MKKFIVILFSALTIFTASCVSESDLKRKAIESAQMEHTSCRENKPTAKILFKGKKGIRLVEITCGKNTYLTECGYVGEISSWMYCNTYTGD